jgi:hypothetical protein
MISFVYNKMSGLRLLSIDAYTTPIRTEHKFLLARECGPSAFGLARAFLIGLLDNLILSQGTIYANWQFVDKA